LKGASHSRAAEGEQVSISEVIDWTAHVSEQLTQRFNEGFAGRYKSLNDFPDLT